MIGVRWWTCFWGHAWSRWREIQRPVDVIYEGERKFQGLVAFQQRECERCGRIDCQRAVQLG